MMKIESNWCKNEFIDIELGDKRLNSRLLQVASDFFENPKSSILHASGSWQAAKGAYRLLDNDKFTKESIIDLHRQKTVSRMDASSSDVFLAIQDTTEIDYFRHPKKKGGLFRS